MRSAIEAVTADESRITAAIMQAERDVAKAQLDQVKGAAVGILKGVEKKFAAFANELEKVSQVDTAMRVFGQEVGLQPKAFLGFDSPVWYVISTRLYPFFPQHLEPYWQLRNETMENVAKSITGQPWNKKPKPKEE